MYPVLYQWTFLGFTRVFAGYGLTVAFGILVGLATAMALARRRGMDPVNVMLAGLVAVGAGLVGSYLLFLATIARQALSDPSILLTGGLVFFGGPIAGLPAGWIAARKLGLRPAQVADLAAPSLSIGHALGRIGCFLGGCCFGRPWDGPWAVTFTHILAPAANPPVPRHPVQLYESAVLLLISIATQLAWRRSTRAGQVGLIYIGTYALWRFFVEMLRGDELRGHVVPGLISTSQAISLAVVPLCLVALVWLHRSRAHRQDRSA